MKRRAFLGSVVAGAAGLSGCAGFLGGDGTDRNQYDVPDRTDEASPTGIDTETPTGGADSPGELSRVVELENAPRTYALSGFPVFSPPDVSVDYGFVRTGTNQRPPEIAVSVANDRDVPAVVYPDRIPGMGARLGQHVPLPGDGTEGDPPEDAPLMLAPTEDSDVFEYAPPIERQGRYWQVKDVSNGVRPEDLRLDPGERVTMRFAVVGGPRTDHRPVGTYRFEDQDLEMGVWNTERPGPRRESRFGGTAVPAPGDRSVIWFHETVPGTKVYLTPSRERTDLPALVEFTFVNHFTGDPGCGGWSLFKRYDGEWYAIDPRPLTLGGLCRAVPPGATAEWSLRAYHGDHVPSEDEGMAVGHLGGGTYAVTAGYGESTDAVGALVEIEADPVVVTADEDVAVRRREGPDVTVARDGVGVEGEPAATVTLARSEESPERTFVAEQLNQPSRWGIRNALAFFETGVDRVSFRTAERPPVARSSFRTPPERFAYDGETYELSVETGQ